LGNDIPQLRRIGASTSFNICFTHRDFFLLNIVGLELQLSPYAASSLSTGSTICAQCIHSLMHVALRPHPNFDHQSRRCWPANHLSKQSSPVHPSIQPCPFGVCLGVV
jgi:hypothetical protein